MLLSSIVVSRDLHGISVLESVLSSLHIHVEVEPELSRARDRMAKSKIDALIVDSDVTTLGDSPFEGVSQSTVENLVPLLICRGNEQIVDHHQAEFLFRKPISVAQAVRTLSSARSMIVERRLRYHRQTVDIETALLSGRRKLNARIMNLSQGGAGLEGNFVDDLSQNVQLNFALPKTKHALQVEGEVVWMREQNRAGVQFKEIEGSVQRQLQLWLEQRFFSR